MEQLALLLLVFLQSKVYLEDKLFLLLQRKVERGTSPIQVRSLFKMPPTQQ